MIRCPPLCSRTRPRGVEKGKRVAILEEEKIVRWAIDDKEDWGREEECYESSKKEVVSHVFEHLIQNLKLYNGVKI